MPLSIERHAHEASKPPCELITVGDQLRIRALNRSRFRWGFLLALAFFLYLPASGVAQEKQNEKSKADSVPTNDKQSATQKATSKETTSEGTSLAKGQSKTGLKTETANRKAVQEMNLLTGSLSKTWSHFSADEKAKLEDAWVLKDVDGQPHLICRGNPKGFLYTKAPYSNFRLTFEWKYISDPNSNSGVLIYTQKEPRLWPTAIQVQLHQPLAGCIFPGGDATSDNSTKPEGLAKDIGKWNTCLIVSEGGKLSVEINGRKAGEVSGCQPSTGFIALQAEGSETHFRKVKLQILPPPEAQPATAATEKVDPQIPDKSTVEDDEPKAKATTFDG